MKNHMMYALKGISAIAVILIHCMFPGMFGIAVKAVARFGVPMFFIISGYYSYLHTDNKFYFIIKNRIIKIIKLILVASIMYFLWNAISLNFNFLRIGTYLKLEFSKVNIIKMVFTNASFFGVHLWYLYAIVYCYIILMIVHKLNLYRLIYCLTPVLLFVHILLGEGFLIVKIGMPDCLLRNWLLMGLPLFMAGNYLRRIENKIMNINNKFVISILILGIILSILSGVFIGSTHMYLGSLFISFGLIVIAIKYPNMLKESFICKTGYMYSSFIYLYHLIAAGIIINIAKNFKLQKNSIFLTIFPLLVITSTIFAASVLYYFKNRIVDINQRITVDNNTSQ